MMLIVGLLLASFAPIWRNAPNPNEGRTVWEHLRDTNAQSYLDSHIPVDEAIAEAKEAYCSCSRINRRA
jgi:hypothetical protein